MTRHRPHSAATSFRGRIVRPPHEPIKHGPGPLRSVLIGLLLVFCLGLAACDNAEDRAEEHFQRSTELLAEGDTPRAIIELRNVFQLVPTHRDARMLYAKIEEDRNNPAKAYSHYRVVTEAFPEDLEAQHAAARLTAQIGDWEAAERHAKAARALMGDAADSDPILAGIELAQTYQEARRNRDIETANAIAREIAVLLEDTPDILPLRMAVIDNQVIRQDWQGALTELDAGIAQHPDIKQLYMTRLAVLEKLGNNDGIEAQLKQLVELFPEDIETAQLLLRWYLAQDRADDAEAWLRAKIDPEGTDPEPRMTLVQFLAGIRGPEAALEELEGLIADLPENAPGTMIYRAAKSGLEFDLGRQDKAMADLQALLEEAAAIEPPAEGEEPDPSAPSADSVRSIKIALAKMYVQTGNPVGARALVEEVLAEDPTEVEALKMRASWLIEDDKPDEALVQLRQALDQAPRDADTLTLMAQAHERAGSRELAGETLSLAVEAANNAPEEALRYAVFLSQDKDYLAAERVLIDALRVRNGHVPMLQALGQIYVQLEDWGRLQGVIDALKREGATQGANELTARLLAAQNRNDELQDFLGQLADSEAGNNQVIASSIRLKLAEGDTEGAIEAIDGYLAERPDDPDLRFIKARVLAGAGNPEAARAELRKLVTEHPNNQGYWVTLYNVVRIVDTREAASAVLLEAMEAQPDNGNLKWMRAGELEKSGDIDGAIAIYEDLYEQNSASVVVANNLASLISANRDDPESLERAYQIARRLRGTDVPAFQDTYGWILARRGDLDEAIEYLEPAAAALADDPTVQYHLARAYTLAERNAEALTAFRATQTALAKTDVPMPFAAEVASEIERLEQAEAAN